MANIVCMTSGLRGLLNASFELVTRLKRNGHSVTYACPWDVREAVEAQGLDYVQLPAVNYSPAPAPERVDGALGLLRSRLAEWRSAPRRRAAGVAALNLGPFRDFIDNARPDLVLIDSELYEHVFTLRQLGTPLVLITPFFPTWQRPGLPPLQLDLTPGDGWRGSRPGIALTWWQRRWRRWREVKMISLRHAFTERRSVLKQYARNVGFPLRHLDEYSSHTMFNLDRLPVLTLTARELDFAHEPRPGVHYVGPMVALERRDHAVSDADRARLDELYARRASDGAPLVYCCLTTMDRRDDGFLGRVIEAFARRPDWRLIVGYSGEASLEGATLPGNVHAFDYVPQLDVLRHSDLCITFGGMNTIHECVSLGVPMLMYPHYYDQPGTTARLVHHGLAHRGDAALDDPADIAQRVERLLGDAHVREKMLAMRPSLARYKADGELERVVDGFLRVD